MPKRPPILASHRLAGGAMRLAALLLLAGCSGMPAPGGPAGAAPAAGGATELAATAPRTGARSARPAAAASASAPASAPAPSQPPAFDVVIKDATRADALFTAWRKDERLWFELRPEDFEHPFFLSPKLSSGIGESGIFGGLMLPSPQLVQFRRVNNRVQLIAVNAGQVARAGTPEARAVAAAVSPSLLGGVAIASQPHPERKTVLIDAGAIFVSDMLGLASRLQRAYRQAYAFDGRESALTGVRGNPDLLVVEVSNHYATAAIALPQPGAPPAAPVPTVPRGLPDPRSMFLGVHYSLARLPVQPMAARPADPRLGHFVTVVDDFTDDLARSPRKRFVDRWRLEKKDPAAALSEPVRPIVFWIDRNMPLKYRAAVGAGILEWNKAFERIGFSGAIEVRQQADDAAFDTLDAGQASVRWMVNREPSFAAIGPSQVDPRSGEILSADIGLESLSSRSIRSMRSEVFGPGGVQAWSQLMQVAGPPLDGDDGWPAASCRVGEVAAEQLALGLDLLALRGELDPDSPAAQRFVLDYLKEVTMHEVGHALGLRHNFRASHVYSDAQVSDPEFSRSQAFTGSVMEYTPINLPRPGEPAAAPFQTTLGPYDYWAIEYAYRPLAATEQDSALARIAARSGEPELAFGTDEDNFLGIDPESLQFDLGDDPLAFATRRFDIVAELFQRQESRGLRADEDYGTLRRSLGYAVREAGRAAGILLRQIGGVRTLRDYPNTGRDPLQPVPAAAQRAAMALLSTRILSADSFVLSPALQRRLAPDFFERSESIAGVPTEFALAQAVLDMQRALLNRLMSDELARRVLDSEGKFSGPDEVFSLRELYRQLEAEIWSELDSSAAIPQPRRELQREHVNRLAALVLRPGAMSRTDARALLRTQAGELLARIDRASQRREPDAQTRLHLADCAESLRSALAAPLERAGA